MWGDLSKKAILFDLDGTLADTLADIAFAMNRALRLHGLAEWPVGDYRYLVGNGAKVLSERAVRDRADLAEIVRADYQAWYERHDLDRSRPYEGMPEALAVLGARGVRLCVLSNKPDADTRRVVTHLFPDARFEVIRGQLPGVPTKPDPAAALAIAAEMGLRPADFLYLGDTAVDMTCARRAGMTPVGALWGFRTAEELAESGAVRLLSRPGELTDPAIYL